MTDDVDVGKPALVGVEGLHFSVSDSGDLALVAVAGREIGVDLERVVERPAAERIAHRFFGARADIVCHGLAVAPGYAAAVAASGGGWRPRLRATAILTVVSESNIELVRRGYEAMLRGDMEGLFDMLDPEIQLHDRAETPDPKTYYGYQGVQESLMITFDMFDDLRFEPKRFLGREDRVVVELRMVGRGKSSGVPVEDRIAHLWKVRDGRAVELRAFSDVADALEAAGLDRDAA